MQALVVAELPARFGAPTAQLDHLAALVRARAPGDLILLGECAISGYLDDALACDPTPFAEPAVLPGEDLGARPASSLTRIASLARETGTTIVAPCIERDDGAFFNALVVVDASGRAVTRYRKRHPWYPERWATPGDAPLARFEHAGLTFALAICFDVHFLADESEEELRAADVLLFASAWVDDDARDARAPIFTFLSRQFDLAIANANWGQGTPRVRGQGRSRVVLRGGESRVLPLAEGPASLAVDLAELSAT